MNNSRILLHKKLVELFKSDNVYYQTPDNLVMKYPCIKYSKSRIKSTNADNTKYNNKTLYQIMVIDKKPDNVVINKILELNYSSYERHYVFDNLNHDVINIYY